MRPYEVSLTREPARPHCYILYSSAELDKVQSYLGKIQTGDIRDHSATLRRPYRIMAASATQMEVEAAPTAPAAAPAPEAPAASEKDMSAEAIYAAIGEHPDPAKRGLLMASIDMMVKRAAEANDKAVEASKKAEAEAARVAALEAQVAASEKSGRLNTAFLGSTLKQYRSDLPEHLEDALDPDLEKQAMTTTDPDVVRAAWSQHMITASMAKMLARQAAAEEPSSDRKRKAEEPARSADVDATHERMKAINSLITGSASTMPPPAATPTTAGSDHRLTEEDLRTAGAMKLAAAFSSFRPMV